MAVTINNNIGSLNVQRWLQRTTADLSHSYQRLSSGLRINTAADDAAGLAIASGLNIDSRVYSQGVRNLNDAASALNIAEGAVVGMSSIVIRLRELAEQSANGTYSSVQRQAMDREAQALRLEFNRIGATASFNGMNLLDGSVGTLSVQAGYSSINLTSLNGMLRGAGDGTFTNPVSYSTTNPANSVTIADLNNDGKLDLISSDAASGTVSVAIGNGDGTFFAPRINTVPLGDRSVVTGDFNGDSIFDIATTGYGLGGITLLFGNGDGYFKSATTVGSGGGIGFGNSLGTGDFNGDGRADLVQTGAGSNVVVMLSNGDGTFNISTTVPIMSTTASLFVQDVNGDGISDIVAGSISSSNYVQVLIGNANGTFRSVRTYATEGTAIFGLAMGDVNGDGVADLLTGSNSGAIALLLGNEDGSFKAFTQMTQFAGSASFLGGMASITDINDDGINDLTIGNGSLLFTSFGNGDGTFSSPASFGSVGGPYYSRTFVEDINNDGIRDIISPFGASGFEIFMGNGVRSSNLEIFSLLTKQSARQSMSILTTAFNRISQAEGLLGAEQGRLAAAGSNLQFLGQNLQDAASRILDVDVAEESSQLMRNKILQQAGAAILAQANQQPALALDLLRNL